VDGIASAVDRGQSAGIGQPVDNRKLLEKLGKEGVGRLETGHY